MENSKMAGSSATFVYLRTASIDQTDRSMALERQWQVCKDVARRHGLDIVDSYTDAGFSGLSPRRPDLDRMLREMSLGRAHYLITADGVRLARELRLRLALELEIAWYGVQLVVASHAGNTSPKRNGEI
jgi:DNA invertase Pin-like site-specific DNA recombinase